MSEEEKEEAMELSPPLFETHSVWTRDMFLELQKYALRAGQCLITVVGILVLLPCLVLFFLEKDWTGFFFAAFWIILTGYFFYLPHLLAKRQHSQYQVVYGGDIECEMHFREDAVISRNLQTGGELAVGYEKFRRIVRTKNLYILYMDKKMVYFFRRDDFVTGDAVSFEAFIAEKCPQAKRKLK